MAFASVTTKSRTLRRSLTKSLHQAARGSTRLLTRAQVHEAVVLHQLAALSTLPGPRTAQYEQHFGLGQSGLKLQQGAEAAKRGHGQRLS